jgi:hypothetical protein
VDLDHGQGIDTLNVKINVAQHFLSHLGRVDTISRQDQVDTLLCHLFSDVFSFLLSDGAWLRYATRPFIESNFHHNHPVQNRRERFFHEVVLIFGVGVKFLQFFCHRADEEAKENDEEEDRAQDPQQNLIGLHGISESW